VQAIGCMSEVDNQKTLLRIIERLPKYLQERWLKVAHDIRSSAKKKIPTIDDVLKFIRQVADERNDPIYGRLADRPSANSQENRKTSMNAVIREQSQSNGNGTRLDSTKTPCALCSGQHGLHGCSVFKGKPVQDRREFAKQNNLCFNCLRKGHLSINCHDVRCCTAIGCGKKHATLLHLNDDARRQISNNSETIVVSNVAECQGNSVNVKGQVENQYNYTGTGFSRVVLPVLPIIVQSPNGERVLTHALLDTGSTNTFCSKHFADKLKLHGRLERVTLATLGNPETTLLTEMCSFSVSDLESKHTIHIDRVYSSRSLPLKLEGMPKIQDIKCWPHLKNLVLPEINTGEIDLLIGQDVPEALIPREVIMGPLNSPYAVKTLLGWTLQGPVGYDANQLRANVNFIESDLKLEHQLEQFWKIDTCIPQEQVYSFDDKRALELWDRSITLVDGHYQLDIPFKNKPKMPDNLPLAQQRLASLKNRLLKDSMLSQAYINGINDLLVKKYAERVPDEVANLVQCGICLTILS
jgi:hypothetical protein